MGTYTAAVIPSTEVKALLEDNWDVQEQNVPTPQIIDHNDGTVPIRFDTRRGDVLIIKVDAPMEEETPIGTWIYGHRRWRLIMELTTKISKVRLWDMKNEIRRICHSKMHGMTNFQRIQYLNFHENTEENQGLWSGRIAIELVNNAVLLDTSNT